MAKARKLGRQAERGSPENTANTAKATAAKEDERSLETRVSLEALCLQYRLHPNLRDLWVEGSDDRAFFSWFLRAVGQHEIVVREIDQVRLDDERLLALGLRAQCNRDRVIALALKLATTLPGDAPHRVLCIADRDRFDLPCPTAEDLLLYTDYRDAEMYLLNERALSKFLLTACHAQNDARVLLTWMVPLLRLLCAIHDANDSLGWGMSKVDPDKYIRYEPSTGQLELDVEGYLVAYLMRNGRFREKAVFVSEVERRQRYGGDDREHIRGHTWLDMLAAYVAKATRRALPVASGLCRAMFSILEVQWLIEEPLFQRLQGPSATEEAG